MNNADMPAMPQSGDDIEQWNDPTNPKAGTYFATGLTKREHFAGLAMQSVLNNFNTYEQGDFDSSDYKLTVEHAVGLADALLAELDERRG
jgi:hypothetical protein